jgi:restriction system protein
VLLRPRAESFLNFLGTSRRLLGQALRLIAMGYDASHRNASEQLGKLGDGVINEDVHGLDRVYVQAKRYAPGNAVSRPEIQAFTGSFVGLNASKGVFVTTSTFAAQAIEFASKIP